MHKINKFKILSFFLLCLGFTKSGLSQDVQFNHDSITQLIKQCKHDSDRVKILNNTALEIDGYLPLESKKYANISLELATKINFESGKAIANKALGIVAYKQGDFSTALKHYFECLLYYENNNYLKGMASMYNNIGLLYGAKNESDKAITFHLKSLNIKKKLNDQFGIASSYNNIGIIYSSIGNIDSSKYYHEKALKIRETINDENGIGTSYYNLANNMFDKENYQLALSYHYKAMNYFRKSKDYFNMAFCLNEIANNHLLLKEYKKCFLYSDSALNIAKKFEITEAEMEVYKTNYQAYSQLKDYKKELENYKLFNELRFKINNQSKAAEIGKIEAKFEYENQIKLQKIEQSKKDEQQLLKNKQQRITIFSITTIALILVFFSGFLYNRFKVIKKQNIIIQKQNIIVEESRKEIVDSINYAKRIQYALLANKELVNKNLNNFILFQPKDIVSGDFYWATEHNNKFYLAVCDCTGHGVPGAFMSLLNIGFLSEAIKEKNISKPNEIFNYVRERLIQSIGAEGQKDGMDGILICLNKVTRDITYSAANNEPIQISEDNIIELPKDRMPVGKGERIEEFKLYSINMKPNDTLYLYTDGYADQFGGPKGKKFKYKQLNELLLSISHYELEKQKEKLTNAIEDWKGDLEQVDDICIVGIKF
jgi:serine phosphatase RsbU (regulator of sigma subunit)